jgi:hypothetical protein
MKLLKAERLLRLNPFLRESQEVEMAGISEEGQP